MSCSFERKPSASSGRTRITCQFSTETRFYKVDGKSYCRFHLEMASGSGQDTEKAAWRLKDHRQFFWRLRGEVLKSIEGGEQIDLAGVVFPIGFKPEIIFGAGESIPAVDFGQCEFIGRVKFKNCYFENTVTFEHAIFEDVCLFHGTVFNGVANFRSVKFNDQANFEFANFKEKVDFELADFGDMAKFENAVFEQSAIFESASFGSWTFFGGARFRGQNGSCFDYAAFNNGVFFDFAEFLGRTSFQVRTEQNRQWNVRRGYVGDGEVNDRKDRNFPLISFKGATFWDRVDFSNRHFLEATDFSEVRFEIAPEFHNCILHQDTDFSGALFKDTRGEHAARAYRILKRAMGDVGATGEEALFYAKEQDALRKRKYTPWSIKIMSWAYMALSDYGRSYVRPVLVFLAMTACFALTYWLWEMLLGGLGDIADAFSFAMKQIVRPFSIWTEEGMAQSELVDIAMHWPLTLRFVATVQSVASISLITLFLLAVRRQFRLH